MKRLILLPALLLTACSSAPVATPPAAPAGPVTSVKYPADWQNYAYYGQTDRYDFKTIRFLYANPTAMTAKPGAPLPYGSVLVMVDRKAKLDEKGNIVRDKNGRFVPTDEIFRISVQEKQQGFGAAIREDLRNGDWEFAIFETSGAVKKGFKQDACLNCHFSRRDNDFVFLFDRFIARKSKSKRAFVEQVRAAELARR